MNRLLEKRLDELAARKTDHIGRLNIVDYGVSDRDYGDGNWKLVFQDPNFDVYRHKKSGAIEAAYRERRTDQQIVGGGGNPAYR